VGQLLERLCKVKAEYVNLELFWGRMGHHALITEGICSRLTWLGPACVNNHAGVLRHGGSFLPFRLLPKSPN
jgi:hypothetical protein